MVTYRAFIDTGYEGANPTSPLDITNRVAAVNWTIGMVNAEDRVAAPLNMQVSLVDPNRTLVDPADSTFNYLLGKIIALDYQTTTEAVAAFWTRNNFASSSRSTVAFNSLPTATAHGLYNRSSSNRPTGSGSDGAYAVIQHEDKWYTIAAFGSSHRRIRVYTTSWQSWSSTIPAWATETSLDDIRTDGVARFIRTADAGYPDRPDTSITEAAWSTTYLIGVPDGNTVTLIMSAWGPRTATATYTPAVPGTTAWQRLVTGWITEVSPTHQEYALETIITASCKLRELQAKDYLSVVTSDILVSQEVAAVLGSGAFLYPYDRSFWVLGVSSLGTTTRLSGLSGAVIDTSTQVIAWSGDNLGEGYDVAAMAYLLDVMSVENGGRLFAARDGQIHFQSQGYDAATSARVSLDAGDVDAESELIQPEVYNAVTVTYYPRRQSTGNEEVYRDSGGIAVAADEMQTFSVKFNLNIEGERVTNVTSIVQPVTGVDIVHDGGAIEAVYSLQGDAVQITLTNTDTDEDALITLLRVRGMALFSSDPAEVYVTDSTSLQRYGLLEYSPLDMRMVATESQARSIGEGLLDRFAEQETRYTRLRWRADDSNSMRLQIGIGDKINFANSLISHDREYMIVGETHQVTGRLHEVEWLLQRAAE